MNRLLKPILTLTLASVLVLVPSLAIAQVENLDEITRSAVVLTAIPPRIGDDGSLVAQPGEIVQTQVRVRNSSQQTLQTRTIVEDFIIGDDGKTPIPVKESTPSRWSMASWTTITTPDNTISPQGSATIPVIIDVPEDALPGGHYAMIMHQPVGATDGALAGDTAGKASVSQRVGTLVYLQVAGDVREDAAIRNINIPRVVEFGPVPFAFAVENLSDIHIRPQITVTVRNMFGQVKETMTMETQNVFPYTLRDFTTEWDRVWGLGRYTVSIEASYGQQGRVATAQAAFWMVPLRLILAGVVLLLAVLGIAVAARRHWLHTHRVEEQHITLLEDRIHQLEQELHTRDRS